MAFGKRKIQFYEHSTVSHEEPITNESETIHVEDNDSELEGEEVPCVLQQEEKRDPQKPLLSEVEFMGISQGKNPGGAKTWRCKHYKKQFNSTYTRIHHHFFGYQAGKKQDIKRCKRMTSDPDAFRRLREKVQKIEEGCLAPRLRSSKLTHREIPKVNIIAESFGVMERETIDMKLMRFLCANGISFNVLRSPYFYEMVTAINNGPKGYKAPSSEKARTTLLDECKKSVERELAPMQDTWYTQGTSIVSDGWSNVKHDPLINVIAANSRGAMFMYAGDFSVVEKNGSVIAEFLLKAIEEIRPSNVIQVVTDNASY